ncbi:hypothetical protein TCAL_07797 [Tigriopus californicus]|uniref:C2H2-type domain-containing protein n=1 Tax=Tigriopus californicus TaxID=6832 RepID=A0A553PTV4_TIGCA|nr:hypothetical protein TCAL_07797 [Tigriopus californicus]
MISCCLCDFQAFSKGNLSFHLNNVHFKDKEFMCRLCHFKTAYKGALTRHVNSVHLRTGKTKECPICGYITASLLNLNSHLSVSHHLEIATAFARPSNLNGGGLSSGPPGAPSHPNGASPDPKEAEPPSRQTSRSSPHRPRLHECRICPFQGQDNTELIMHYNLVHLNPAHTVLSRDSVANVAAAAAAARHHLPTSSAGYLPSPNAGGEEEPRDFSVIRDSELLLRRRASSYFYLKNHIRTSHLGEVHTVACPLCEYTSDAKGDIEAHLQEDHPQKYADKRSVITID